MFLCKECLTCGRDFHPSGSRGPCESCRHTTITADCHHDSSGAFESLAAEKKRLELEKERKEDVVEHLHSREGEFITEDDLIELARVPILEDEIGRLQWELAKDKEIGITYEELETVNLRLAQQRQSLRQQVKALRKALTNIQECAHGIMPAHRDHKHHLKEIILGLKDAQWIRLDAILYAAETALATTPSDRCETCGRVAPLHWEKSHWKCPVPTTPSAAEGKTIDYSHGGTFGRIVKPSQQPVTETEVGKAFIYKCPEGHITTLAWKTDWVFCGGGCSGLYPLKSKLTTETTVCPCTRWWGSQCDPCKAKLPNLPWGGLPLPSYHSPNCTNPGCGDSDTLTPVEETKVNDSKWCDVCELYHEPNATSWSHAVKKSELEEGYQNDEQTNTLCQVCGGLGEDGKYSCESCNGSGIAGLMKWCENCHGYHDPNGPHPAGSAR